MIWLTDNHKKGFLWAVGGLLLFCPDIISRKEQL